MYQGIPQNDIGIRTDVLDNIPKAIGMKMLVRSMGPQVICADEIGTIGDSESIKEAFCSGIQGIFTAHGNSYQSLKQNPILREMIKQQLFETIILIDEKEKGKINDIIKRN